MVQVTRGQPNVRAQAWSNLADSLGMAIGEKVNSYYADKALNSALDDETYKDKPASERLGIIQQKLAPYGKHGQQVLENRMKTEALREQENEEKKNIKKGDVLRRRLAGEEVSEKEKQLFTPTEELAIAKHQQAIPLQEAKNAGKKQPLSTQPISQEQLSAIDKAHAIPGYKDKSETQKYNDLIHSGVSPENAIKEATLSKEEGIRENQKVSNENKAVTESYKENQDYINQTYDRYEDTLRKEAITDRMIDLEQSGETSESGVINLLETLGFQPEWLKNPANEEYNKLGLDLLGGGTLQADYGSRVLASEFKVSQQRIPSLMQTPEGRRQITENIRTMMLPAKLKQEKLQEYLDESERTGKPLPHNLRGKILKDIKPQLEDAYNKFKQRNGRYEVKKGTQADDNAIEKYYYISNGNLEKAKSMMKDDGYDVD